MSTPANRPSFTLDIAGVEHDLRVLEFRARDSKWFAANNSSSPLYAFVCLFVCWLVLSRAKSRKNFGRLDARVLVGYFR